MFPCKVELKSRRLYNPIESDRIDTLPMVKDKHRSKLKTADNVS